MREINAWYYDNVYLQPPPDYYTGPEEPEAEDEDFDEEEEEEWTEESC